MATLREIGGYLKPLSIINAPAKTISATAFRREQESMNTSDGEINRFARDTGMQCCDQYTLTFGVDRYKFQSFHLRNLEQAI